MFIDYNEIPGYKDLMLDFIYDFENVEDFYLKNFRDEKTFNDHIQIVSQKDLPHRQKLVEIIKSQYLPYSPSQLTKKNINSLLSNKTFAVVAAQQLGLFGGPLGYFYKIISAVKLSRLLKEKYEDLNFVPVFWLEGEDHGFETVNKTYTYTKESGVKKVEYKSSLTEEENLGSVGDIILDEEIEETTGELFSILKETEHSEQVRELISGTYRIGKTYTEAFRKLLFNLFDEYGLIIFDFNEREPKLLARGLFSETVKNQEALAMLGIQRSARLEENYHVQLKVHPVNLYLLDKNRRLRLEPHERGFRIGNTRKILSESEILEIINSNPEKISPDVILRPIVQDTILPTAVTIAGPNEMNYFPQVIPYYSYFNLETPLLYPRASATLNESFLQKKIEIYNLTPQSIFVLSEKELTDKILRSDPNSHINSIFDETEHEIDFAIDRLKEKLFAIDPDLTKDAQEVRDGILKLMAILRKKGERSNASKVQAIIRHSKLLKNQFRPNGKAQEEIINFVYFANKYGLDVLKLIFDELSITSFEHQIINL